METPAPHPQVGQKTPRHAHYAEDIRLLVEFAGSEPGDVHELELLTCGPGASLSYRPGRLSGAGTFPG
jgi:hypothetical protein